MDLTTTRPKNVTYLGVPAVVQDVRKGARSTNERVSFVRWVGQATEKNGSHPAGTIVARHITGDGRLGSGPAFVEFAVRVFPPSETAHEESRAWAQDRLTGTAADCTPAGGC